MQAVDHVQAVLDGVLDRLTAEFPEQRVTIELEHTHDGLRSWRAYCHSDGYGPQAHSPEQAAAGLITKSKSGLLEKRAFLQAELADVEKKILNV